MKITLNTSDIARKLKADQNAAWTWDGARALAEYLEELEESTGEEMELDVCSIRCDFSEYTSLEEWVGMHFASHVDAVNALGLTLGDGGALEESTEEQDDSIRAFIQDHGTLIEFDGGVIVSCF